MDMCGCIYLSVDLSICCTRKYIRNIFPGTFAKATSWKSFSRRPQLHPRTAGGLEALRHLFPGLCQCLRGRLRQERGEVRGPAPYDNTTYKIYLEFQVTQIRMTYNGWSEWEVGQAQGTWSRKYFRNLNEGFVISFVLSPVRGYLDRLCDL